VVTRAATGKLATSLQANEVCWLSADYAVQQVLSNGALEENTQEAMF